MGMVIPEGSTTGEVIDDTRYVDPIAEEQRIRDEYEVFVNWVFWLKVRCVVILVVWFALQLWWEPLLSSGSRVGWWVVALDAVLLVYFIIVLGIDPSCGGGGGGSDDGSVGPVIIG